MSTFARNLTALGLAALFAVGLSACNDSKSNPVDNGGGGGDGGGGGGGSIVAAIDGPVTADRTLHADSVYVIKGYVEVEPGATLTIPAGTQLLSDPETKGSIVTRAGAGGKPSGRLVVNGTASNPVVFRPGTGAGLDLAPSQVTSCARGTGGGVVLHGLAPINLPGGTGISEGVFLPFGGDNPADDSGDINYLVIVCGGVKVTPDNEINGLTFAGVGSGTHISHVQSHLIADDGFEWFGGTVNADHLVSSGNDDDNFDCDNGWQGTLQFGFAIEDRNLANRGIECDNDADGTDNLPQTTPSFWNITQVGAGVMQANNEINDGWYLRRNSAPKIHNAMAVNFGNVGAVIDGSKSQANATSGELEFDHVLFFGNKNLASAANQAAGTCLLENVAFKSAAGYTTDGVEAAFGGSAILCDDPQLTQVNYDNPINGSMPDPRPQTGSPALDAGNAATPSGTGIVDGSANYVGAFSAGENWLTGWTVWVTAQ